MITALLNQLIIFSLLFILSLSNMINGEHYCNPISCPTSNTIYVPSISVQYPFRIANQQPLSCGLSGFDLYCDDSNQGVTLVNLPNNVTLRVDHIYYTTNQMYLTDLNYCLPRMLISLDIIDTPFRLSETGLYTDLYSLYNCSGDNARYQYDRIECLSGSNYSVIKTTSRRRYDVLDQNCKFIRSMKVPLSYLSCNNSSGFYLDYRNGTVLDSNPSPTSYGPPGSNSKISQVGSALVIAGIIVIFISFFYACICKNNNRRSTTIMAESPRTSTTPAGLVPGLDKITIDSYPVVVLGESGGLIKPDDNTCAICLSEYCPNEILKILPECLHRFHVECIDQWLGCKGMCPICRTSTPSSSTPILTS